MKKSKHSDIINILRYQSLAPFTQSAAVEEILHRDWDKLSVTTLRELFLVGYIEGKRAERARRKVGMKHEIN